MSTWLEDITKAISNLGGIAHYDDIYSELKILRKEALPPSWKNGVQRIIQNHSSDSDGFKGKDLFYSVKGIGSGVWGLKSKLCPTPSAIDLAEPDLPQRALIKTYRILRDTELARKLKALHSNICQVCEQTINLGDGTQYSEAHHIRPLGSPHNGPDIAGNIIVVCPNHHAQLDYGAIKISSKQLKTVHGHKIDLEYINYHNDIVCKKDPFKT